ncbi:MAG: hypothetical protein ACF8NJ_06535 [Phycisphaerales bacterium JB038]
MPAKLDKFDLCLALLTVIATASFAFFLYNLLRTWDEYAGFDWSRSLRWLLWSLVITECLTIVLGGLLVGLPLLDAYRRAELRQQQGRCARCDYSLQGLRGDACPECGEPLPTVTSAHPGRIYERRLQRCLLLLALGTMLGASAGAAVAEGFILLDEQRFLAEVEAHRQADGPSKYARPRAWPNGNAALVYLEGEGVHATE